MKNSSTKILVAFLIAGTCLVFGCSKGHNQNPEPEKDVEQTIEATVSNDVQQVSQAATDTENDFIGEESIESLIDDEVQEITNTTDKVSDMLEDVNVSQLLVGSLNEYKFKDDSIRKMFDEDPIKAMDTLLESRLKKYDNAVVDVETIFETPFRGRNCSDIATDGIIYLAVSGGRIVKLLPRSAGMELEDINEQICQLNSSFPTNSRTMGICRFDGQWALGTYGTNGVFLLSNDLSSLKSLARFPKHFTPRVHSMFVFNERLHVFGHFKDNDNSETRGALLRLSEAGEFEAIWLSDRVPVDFMVAGNTVAFTEKNASELKSFRPVSCRLILYSEDKFFDTMYDFEGHTGGMCYNPDEGLFLICGNRNKIYSSRNLINWNVDFISHSREIFGTIGLDYINGIYIMSTQYEICYVKSRTCTWAYYSLDGIVWEEVPGEARSACGYSIQKVLGDKLFLGAVEGGPAMLVSIKPRTRFDRRIVGTYADKEELKRHIADEMIHVTPVEKMRLVSTNQFDGRYSSLIGAPKIIESTSQLINDSAFLDEEGVKIVISKAMREHPTYKIEEIDNKLSNLEIRMLNHLSKYVTLPANDNNNLRFILIMDHGKIMWVPDEEKFSLH